MSIPMKRMPTVMKAGRQFQGTPSIGVERSVFDRSHGWKGTFDAGLIIPFFWDEVVPGDTMTLRATVLARLNTLIKPLMDNLYLDTQFLFCPYRLIWTNFVKFMGEQANPGDSIAFTTPQYTGMPAAGYGLGTVFDYLGLPTAGTPAVTASISHSALPMRALALMYNQWYRDENAINSVVVPLSDGPDTSGGSYINTLTPFKRNKRPDYFTGGLPFLQKGTAVSMPLGSQAPLRRTDAANPGIVSVLDSVGTGYQTLQVTAVNTDARAGVFGGAGSAATRLYADLSGATAATINDFRQAVGVQQFLERDARGGTRYKELIWAHFHVMSDDARLDRTEYLGGGSTPIAISPAMQSTVAAAPTNKDQLGNLGGVAAGIASGHGFTKSFTEHGIVLGFVNVRADLTYSQGLERFWSRSTRYDHFWKILEELGEQAILNKEIFATGAAADANVFAYQERYGEYKYKPSKLVNLFRPSAAGTLEFWHLSEKFGALPTWGQTFIEDQTETVLDTRVGVPAEPDMQADVWFEYTCARPLRASYLPGLRRL